MSVSVPCRSNRSTGRAVIVSTPEQLATDGDSSSIQFAGRYLVQFIPSGLAAHVRPERLLPVFKQRPLLLVTYSTDDYRRLARSQVAMSSSCMT
jgi:hypothetical protein